MRDEEVWEGRGILALFVYDRFLVKKCRDGGG